MKKNLRVIQINGFRGLFLALFAVSCLIAGFIAFPTLLTMHIWNYLSATTGSFPLIGLGEAVLLWAIIIFSFFIFNKKKLIVSCNVQQELTNEEVKEVVEKIRLQKNKLQSLPPQDLNLPNFNKLEENSKKGKNSDAALAQSENKEN